MFDKDTNKVKSKAMLENEYGITVDDMKYNNNKSFIRTINVHSNNTIH